MCGLNTVIIKIDHNEFAKYSLLTFTLFCTPHYHLKVICSPKPANSGIAWGFFKRYSQDFAI